ncbi:MAG TPA: PfkB family carbohydrate kinase [Thermoplasmata archaeon]|nr:PfkB family carbohydrate kinase [Thermoplasmata archaeon]
MVAEGHGRSRDLLVVGHTVIDRFWHVPRLPARDRTVPVESVDERLGGTAANLAQAASGEGLRVGLVSRVGPEFPPEFRRTLRASRIDLTGLETVEGERTPSALIVEDGRGGQMTLIDQGAMGDASRARLPTGMFPRYPWVHLTTGDPSYMLRFLQVARAGGAHVAADPAQEIHYRWTAPMLRRMLPRCELFFGNEAETAVACRMMGVSGADRLTRFVPLLIVTRGRKGARAYSRTGMAEVPGRVPRVLRQVTGAGDSFRGGFYAAWLRGAPIGEALADGVGSATRWIETARFPTRGAA